VGKGLLRVDRALLLIRKFISYVDPAGGSPTFS
jgi:hypothetical protein